MFSGGDDKEEEEICKKIKSSRKYREFSDFVDLNRKKLTEVDLEYLREAEKDGKSHYAYIYEIKRTKPKTSPISKSLY